jgi:phytoene dehydrogenase-like protein
MDWLLFTPDDFRDRVGVTAGNIRHLDMIPSQFLDQRLFLGAGYQAPIRGLYLCGARTHPGGEVSGASGDNPTQAILRHVRDGG